MSADILSFTPCPECCVVTCPEPSVEWDSRSASKTKFGFYEWLTKRSTPPKIYSQIDWTGTMTITRYVDTTCSSSLIYYTDTYTISGTGRARRDVSGCDESSTLKRILSTQNYKWDGDTRVPDGDPIVSEEDFFPPILDCVGSYVYGGPGEARYIVAAGDPPHDASLYTATVLNSLELSCAVFGDRASTGNLYNVLSDEYLTADLIAAALAALPAFDGDWDDTAGAYRNLTSDELTYSIREARYRLRFQIPTTRKRINTCYKVEWVERFTPESGDPVDTPMSATWDGVVPDGYDPDDSSTWPILGDGTNPYFELPVPDSNGITTVVDVTVSCTGCE